MLRFRLGPIPVEVHFQHLLFALLFAGLLQPDLRGAPERWPHPLLSASNPQYTRTLLACVLVWMGIIFVSVLVHELGHALTSLAFGYRPRIHLLWMGGHTQVGAEEVHPGADIPWHRDVLLTLAGPTFGLLLGLGCLGLAGAAHASPVGNYAFFNAGAANILWALLNLVPIQPLDGGRVARVLLVRVLGERGRGAAKTLSVAVAGGAVLLALLVAKDPLLALIVGMWLVRAVTLPTGARRARREVGARAPRTPGERALELAEESFREGDLDAARRRCLLLVEDEETPRALRSRAHHVLGWIALKEGKGRLALDHFSQVGEAPRVEAHALAASFSLIGDEHRALSLWELAYREGKSPTVLHEWAGAFIRAGRVDMARKLPNVDLELAYRCAQRVLSIREDHSEAARVGLAGLTERPSAQLAYDTACALARAGDRAKALEVLIRASALGFRDKDYAETDSDLAALQHEPGFTAWLASLGENPSP